MILHPDIACSVPTRFSRTTHANSAGVTRRGGLFMSALLAGATTLGVGGCQPTPVIERPTARTEALAHDTVHVKESPLLAPVTPAARQNAPAAEIDDLRLTTEQEQEIGGLVDRSYFLLLENQVQAALEELEDARTVPYWTQSVYAPDLLFWLGHAYDRLNERSAAIVHYRQLVEHYPDTPLADRAQSRLRELRDGANEPPVTAGTPAPNASSSTNVTLGDQ